MEITMRIIMIGLAVIAMLLNLARAANYTVGAPNGGWDASSDLQTWASSQSFLVGDNLIFENGGNHNVYEVSKADYEACQTSNAIQVHNEGTTIIPLSSPGQRYFICGTPGHCSLGMKLQILVNLATASAPSSSIAAPPTTPPPTLSPSPSPLQLPELIAPSVSPQSQPAAPESHLNTPISSPTNVNLPPPSSSSANKQTIQTSLTLCFSFIGVVLLPFKAILIN